MSNVLAQAKLEMNRHGYLVETTSLRLIAEVERMRAELGEQQPEIATYLKAKPIEDPEGVKALPTAGELRVEVDPLVSLDCLSDFLLEAAGWPEHLSPEDRQQILDNTFGTVPDHNCYPFTDVPPGATAVYCLIDSSPEATAS